MHTVSRNDPIVGGRRTIAASGVCGVRATLPQPKSTATVACAPGAGRGPVLHCTMTMQSGHVGDVPSDHSMVSDETSGLIGDCFDRLLVEQAD